MKRSSLGWALCLIGLAGGIGAAQPRPRAGSHLPRQQQPLINLNLIEALVSIKEESLAGLFSYIPEADAAPAFADYLYRNSGALKLFLKKGEKDLKAAGGINEWDKQVYLYLVTINANGPASGAAVLPAKLLDRVSTLSLAPGLPLSEFTMRRKK